MLTTAARTLAIIKRAATEERMERGRDLTEIGADFGSVAPFGLYPGAALRT